MKRHTLKQKRAVRKLLPPGWQPQLGDWVEVVDVQGRTDTVMVGEVGKVEDVGTNRDIIFVRIADKMYCLLVDRLIPAQPPE